MDKYCRGCGARLQTEDPGDYGYIPSHMVEKGDLICQRCFRIIHYNKDELGPVLADTSLQALKDATQWADHVGLVVDLLDFEAGLPPTLLDYAASKTACGACQQTGPLAEANFCWRDCGLGRSQAGGVGSGG